MPRERGKRRSAAESLLPEPMVPVGCDLRDFPKIMIDIGRLFASSFNATASRKPLAWMVGHKLWYRSWHQVPAASLPDDDEELCHLAELGLDLRSFRTIKGLAMRGWVKCGDGRLYHPVVAEAALEAWIHKLGQRKKSAKGNAAKYKHAFDPRPFDAEITAALGMLASINPKSKILARSGHNPPCGSAGGILGGVPAGSQEIGIGTVSEEKYPSQGSGTELEVIHGGRA